MRLVRVPVDNDIEAKLRRSFDDPVDLGRLDLRIFKIAALFDRECGADDGDAPIVAKAAQRRFIIIKRDPLAPEQAHAAQRDGLAMRIEHFGAVDAELTVALHRGFGVHGGGVGKQQQGEGQKEPFCDCHKIPRSFRSSRHIAALPLGKAIGQE